MRDLSLAEVAEDSTDTSQEIFTVNPTRYEFGKSRRLKFPSEPTPRSFVSNKKPRASNSAPPEGSHPEGSPLLTRSQPKKSWSFFRAATTDTSSV